MHDRRIDGNTHVFGNAGALYMRAMTWWDHATQSIWSQPWGRAIEGRLKGVSLALLPSQVTTWENWKQDHPDTQVMVNETNRLRFLRQRFDPDFVIGIVVADQAKAYPYREVAKVRVLNDHLGELPVFIWAFEGNFRVYLRQVGDQVLTFRIEGESLIDEETGSYWDVQLGLAISGKLSGEALRPIPSLTAYDWAWVDFYPQSEIYEPLPQ